MRPLRVIVACCLLQRVAHIEYCRVHSHGSLPIVATNESGGGCLPLLAARTRRRCRTPFDSIPRLPLSRLQRARLPMRSHAHALLASALIRLFASPLPLFASPLPLFALPLPSFASSAPVSVTQHSTSLGAYTWLLPKQSRCRCGSARPGPGADVAGPVPEQMWPEWSGRRCGAHLLAQRPIRTTHHNAARSRRGASAERLVLRVLYCASALADGRAGRHVSHRASWPKPRCCRVRRGTGTSGRRQPAGPTVSGTHRDTWSKQQHGMRRTAYNVTHVRGTCREYAEYGTGPQSSVGAGSPHATRLAAAVGVRRAEPIRYRSAAREYSLVAHDPSGTGRLLGSTH